MLDKIRCDGETKENVRDSDLPLGFIKDRHTDTIVGINCITQTWRMKERMKTVSVALVLCLNVGVDPPDIVKTQPCARLECWIDPLSLTPTKALQAVGNSLQKQYERWQPRARYKQSLDPIGEDLKKLCTSLRRNAKEERVLFHYNGHGVPKPTANGEIWVFNRNYTQYIPLSVYDLQLWMGAPSIYVYDCSNAGIIVESFKQFAEQHEREAEKISQGRGPPPSIPSFKNCIQLAACSSTQVLPMNPDLPADLFTACLTTPIKVALRWFVMQNTAKLVPKVTLDLIDKIPGQLNDRRTMLGELNWIFTAITDTIAWNTLPRDLFQKLFRQDLLVASLFRNFLLAERTLRSYDCTPLSWPNLPPTFQHPMWQAWDLALDLSLGQLPKILSHEEPFVHLPFFEEQLTAFQVWLELGSEKRSPPEQLPIVLQVLLSQVHRLRALELLGRFLDLGPWAVNLALSVGIFPYVLKLLQSSAKELRPLLVFIWAKILAVDSTCQADLVRDNGHKYFLSVLQDPTVTSEHRTLSAFVLASMVHGYRDGQEAARQGSLVSVCLEQLSDASPQLRQWLAICLARLWDHYDKARWTGVRDIAHEKLYTLLKDPSPEVRAAAVYALGTFINSVTKRSEHANNIDHSIAMTLLNTVSGDMSCLVRQELIAALQWVVLLFEHSFLSVAAQEGGSQESIATASPAGMRKVGSKDRLRIMSPPMNYFSDQTDNVNDRLKRVASSSSISSLGHGHLHHGCASFGTISALAYGSVYRKLWNGLCNLDTDPHPLVAQMSCLVTGYIKNQIKEWIQMSEYVTEIGCGSISLPPSPNRGNYIVGDSPPLIHGHMSRSTLNSKPKKLVPSTISEEADEANSTRNPLVKTLYVPWACKHFAQPVTKETQFHDVESMLYYEREWRYIRNTAIRKEAKEEQRRASSNRLETQVFNIRYAAPPVVTRFHPYDQQIVVAGRESFGIWDWGTGAKLSYCQCKSTRSATSRITALEWVNGHDVALLMVGSDDGSIKLWRPNSSPQNREPVLVSAWQAFNELQPSSKTNAPGLVLTWEQWTQTVITSGDTRVLRLWDAEKELKAFDIPTGADCSVTCLDSTFASTGHDINTNVYQKDDPDDDGLVMGPEIRQWDGQRAGELVAGCADGSVRLYDRRLNPGDARIKTWREHTDRVLDVQLRDNEVISGSAAGDVRIYDIRINETLKVIQASQGMTALTIHRYANTFACGSINQNIGIYNLAGDILNIIRFYEGFMGHRTGPISCLSYHPHRVALATGTTDSSVSVYCLDNRR